MSRDHDDDREYDEEDHDEERESSRKSKRHEPTQEDKQMAMFCHLGGLLAGIILPLILWLIYKDKSRFIDERGKEALNFDITMFIASVVGGIATCGVLLIVILPIVIIFHIQGAMAANRGESYRYPLTIRFIT